MGRRTGPNVSLEHSTPSTQVLIQIYLRYFRDPRGSKDKPNTGPKAAAGTQTPVGVKVKPSTK